jgi:hypothetical protein
MGTRDMFFVGLVLGGAALLGANLLPPRAAGTDASGVATAEEEPDFRTTVGRVDGAFRAQWSEQGLRPAPAAPELAIARRLSLGLMGTIPSLEEVRRLEALPQGQRLLWWVRHLLEDRRFADYFAERLARAFVGTEDGPFIFYRRRRFVTWLADQLAANRPYDALVRELITSGGLWTDHPAINFVSVTSQPDNQNQPDPVRLAARVTRAFLGLRLDCAQCHDHPFAAWKQADFRGLAAFFGQTRLGFTGVHEEAGEFEAEDRKTGARGAIEPRVPFASELLPLEGSRRERLAAWITDPKNQYFARAAVNRVWALLLGRPLVEPVDNLEFEAGMPPALELLAEDFASHGFDLRRLIRLTAATEVFQHNSAADHDVGEAEERVWAVFPLTRLRPEQVAGSLLQASSVTTIDAESHILVRLMRYDQQNNFVQRYGDVGEDEFGSSGGTIPQRLLLMNGSLLREKVQEGLFNASTRIAWLAPDDAHAVEAAYLTVLTRRPSPPEAAHFEAFLARPNLKRTQRLEDLFWALLNSTEFSWNH